MNIRTTFRWILLVLPMFAFLPSAFCSTSPGSVSITRCAGSVRFVNPISDPAYNHNGMWHFRPALCFGLIEGTNEEVLLRYNFWQKDVSAPIQTFLEIFKKLGASPKGAGTSYFEYGQVQDGQFTNVAENGNPRACLELEPKDVGNYACGILSSTGNGDEVRFEGAEESVAAKSFRNTSVLPDARPLVPFGKKVIIERCAAMVTALNNAVSPLKVCLAKVDNDQDTEEYFVDQDFVWQPVDEETGRYRLVGEISPLSLGSVLRDTGFAGAWEGNLRFNADGSLLVQTDQLFSIRASDFLNPSCESTRADAEPGSTCLTTVGMFFQRVNTGWQYVHRDRVGTMQVFDITETFYDPVPVKDCNPDASCAKLPGELDAYDAEQNGITEILKDFRKSIATTPTSWCLKNDVDSTCTLAPAKGVKCVVPPDLVRCYCRNAKQIR